MVLSSPLPSRLRAGLLCSHSSPPSCSQCSPLLSPPIVAASYPHYLLTHHSLTLHPSLMINLLHRHGTLGPTGARRSPLPSSSSLLSPETRPHGSPSRCLESRCVRAAEAKDECEGGRGSDEYDHATTCPASDKGSGVLSTSSGMSLFRLPRR